MVCYRNLRRRDWSIAEVRGNDGIGRVIAHEHSVALANVTFVVKEPALAGDPEPLPRGPCLGRGRTGEKRAAGAAYSDNL